MVKKAYVVRSGGRNFGDFDGTLLTKIAGLSENGKVAIQNTRQLIDELIRGGTIRLADQPFKCSPFARAIQTAKILAKGRSCEIINELCPLESSWNFLQDNFPDAVWCEIKELFENQAAGLLHAEGERLLNFIVESISKINPEESVVIVSHSRMIEAAMAIVSGNWAPLEFAVKEGDIIVFNFSDKNIFIADNPFAILGHLRPSPEN